MAPISAYPRAIWNRVGRQLGISPQPRRTSATAALRDCAVVLPTNSRIFSTHFALQSIPKKHLRAQIVQEQSHLYEEIAEWCH